VIGHRVESKTTLRLCVEHGRRNGFESGTAEGVEHEPPKNRDAEGGEGVWTKVFPLPTRGSGGVTPVKIYGNPCADWCIFERKSLMKLLGHKSNIAFITMSVRLNLMIVPI